MPCGSCGGRKRASSKFEVTYKDGSKEVFSDYGSARIAAAKDATTGRPSATIKSVTGT
jgi:hypothetical protein